MVLLWHFTGSLIFDPRWLAHTVQFLTIFGRTGVDLFFVLSGYLIIGILIDYRDSPNVIQVFYWRRFLRIWPPYLLLIATYWCCYFALGESAAFNTNGGATVQVMAQLLFAWNWIMAVADGPVARAFSVTWSVAIEEWFYLIAPWLILACSTARLPRLLLTIGILSIVGRAVAYLVMGSHLAPYILTPFRLDGLCAGGLLAWALRTPEFRLLLEKNKESVGRLVLGFVIAAPLFVAFSKGHLDRNMHLFGHTFLSVGYTLVLLWLIQNLGSSRTLFFRNDFLREAGRYSYTLYLFHPLFISLYFVLAGRSERILSYGDVLLAFAALASSIAFAALSFRIMERPLSKLGHRLNYISGGISGATNRERDPERLGDRDEVKAGP